MRLQPQVLLTSLCILVFSIANAQTAQFTSSRVNKSTARPARLTSFTGTEKNNGVSLSWSTAGEQNSSHFIVEHSTDGLQFDSIGAVTAVGRFQLPTTYQFEDLQTSGGNHYYRLKIKNLNGKDNYGRIFKIETTAKAASLVALAQSRS